MNENEPSPPAATTNLVGAVLSDRYRIDTLLGEGGMGAVYLGEHQLMHKRVAIKVLHPEMMGNSEVVARFEREAMAAAHIDHPNVAAATDFGRTPDGAFFLVLEYLEGKSLRDTLGNAGALPQATAAHVAYQVALALSKAHGRGIVHRDLKPENVMIIERDGDPCFVKVLDFGIAKVPVDQLAGQAVASPQGLTRLGVMYGTPEYMAPEQALGQAIDHRADLYALGVMLYEMLCGERPFVADNVVGIVTGHVTGKVPPLAPRVPGLSPAFEALVNRLLEKSPDRRPASAREIADELARMAQGGLSAASPAPPAAASGPMYVLPTGLPPGVGNLPTAMPDVGGARLPTGLGASAGNLPTDMASVSGWNVGQPDRVAADAAKAAYLPTALPQSAPSLAPAPSASDGASAHTAVAEVPAGLASGPADPPAPSAPSGASSLDGPAGANGPLAKLEALVPPDIMNTLRGAMPPQLKGVSPLIPVLAAAALAGLFGLMLLGVVVSKLRSPPDPSAPSGPSIFSPFPAPTAASSAELSQAREAGLSALEPLAAKFPKDPAVLKALVLAYHEQKKPAEAMTSLAKLAPLSPDVASDDTIRAALRAAAEGPTEAADEAFSLMEGPLGEPGADYLYELWTTKEVKDKVQERAGKSLGKAEVRDHTSPPVHVLIELKQASSCEGKKKVLPRAKESGDKRALKQLQTLTMRRGCGFAGLGDCWSCMRADTQLSDAIKAIESRAQ